MRPPVQRGLVGVLGGMGPLATIDFMQKVLAATPARRDQDHVPMIVSSIPQVPDRAQAFRGDGPSPLPAMVDGARRLVGAGAGLIVMPCHTAHVWFDALRAEVPGPMLHIADAVLSELSPDARADGVGLLATTATLDAGMYTKRAHPNAPRQWIEPTGAELADLVMPGIRLVKAGQLDAAAALLAAAAQRLVSRGARTILLACTEIPPVLSSSAAGVPLIDATGSLARAAVAWSRAQTADGPHDALVPPLHFLQSAP